MLTFFDKKKARRKKVHKTPSQGKSQHQIHIIIFSKERKIEKKIVDALGWGCASAALECTAPARRRSSLRKPHSDAAPRPQPALSACSSVMHFLRLTALYFPVREYHEKLPMKATQENLPMKIEIPRPSQLSTSLNMSSLIQVTSPYVPPSWVRALWRPYRLSLRSCLNLFVNHNNTC